MQNHVQRRRKPCSFEHAASTAIAWQKPKIDFGKTDLHGWIIKPNDNIKPKHQLTATAKGNAVNQCHGWAWQILYTLDGIKRDTNVGFDFIFAGESLKFIDVCPENKAPRFERMKHKPCGWCICQLLRYICQFMQNSNGQNIYRFACHIKAKPDNIISILFDMPMFKFHVCQTHRHSGFVTSAPIITIPASFFS